MFINRITLIIISTIVCWSQAHADSCIVADPTDSSLNVRDSPNGTVINRIRNGREITIQQLSNDSKGRPWGYATGRFKGKNRNWGWVFMEAVQCGGSRSATTEVSASKWRMGSCVIFDQTDTSLNVRDAPNGKVVNRLRNGRRVNINRLSNDAKGRPWGYATGIFKGKNRNWGWVFMEGVDCGDARTADSGARSTKVRYPLFADGSKDLNPFGIHIGNFDRDSTKVAPFSRKCFYYGDGGYSMSLSNRLIVKNEKRGISFKTLCAGLRVENLRFDPETGRRLPTYKVGNSIEVSRNVGEYSGAGVVSEELPFMVPPCFRGGQVVRVDGAIELRVNCNFKYDTKTGGKLKSHQAVQGRKFFLFGDAGPSGEIVSQKLLVSSKRSNTKAAISSVLSQQ